MPHLKPLPANGAARLRIINREVPVFFDENNGGMLTEREAQLQQLAREIYQERLQLGVAREQARKDLPLSTYTEAYWKIDLNNLLNFLALRMDSHAQFEIRSMPL